LSVIAHASGSRICHYHTLPKAGAVDIDEARKIFGELTAQADDWLTAEKVAAEDRRENKVAMLLYHGQGGEVAVP